MLHSEVFIYFVKKKNNIAACLIAEVRDTDLNKTCTFMQLLFVYLCLSESDE